MDELIKLDLDLWLEHHNHYGYSSEQEMIYDALIALRDKKRVEMTAHLPEESNGQSRLQAQ